MDTMTTTKIVGGVCGSFLILLLLKWGGEIIFHGGGHGDTEAAYSIEVDEAPVVDGDTGPTFDELLAQADIGKGERVFGKCKACHKLGEGENGTGPNLYQIVGRDRAAVGDFTYSGGMAAMGGAWSPEDLDAFLLKPRDFVAGTTMTFSGLAKATDRANVIAYLSSLGE